MKRYIKPETILIDICGDNICGGGMTETSVPFIPNEETVVKDPEEVLSKKDVWDMEW